MSRINDTVGAEILTLLIDRKAAKKFQERVKSLGIDYDLPEEGETHTVRYFMDLGVIGNVLLQTQMHLAMIESRGVINITRNLKNLETVETYLHEMSTILSKIKEKINAQT